MVLIDEEHDAYNFKNLFRVIQTRLQYCKSNGEYSQLVTRICFERGDSAGVLLHDPVQDQVILVRQFRYPAFVRLRNQGEMNEHNTGWLLEIAAGIMEDNDYSEEDVVHRELLEETGYYIKGTPKHISTIFPSPGGSSERIHIFIAEVDRTKAQEAGGGLLDEGEDTEVVIVQVDEALALISRGEIQDAKTVLALQHLELLRYKACSE